MARNDMKTKREGTIGRTLLQGIALNSIASMVHLHRKRWANIDVNVLLKSLCVETGMAVLDDIRQSPMGLHGICVDLLQSTKVSSMDYCDNSKETTTIMTLGVW